MAITLTADPNDFIVGIYARQSELKLDSCSIEMQVNRGIEFCNSIGWKYVIYKDPGYSGKDTDRPDFQRMMRDARTGKINMILVFRLNRISRSVSDLAQLLEELVQMGVEFKSLSEHFDTTTPIGRAMVYIAGVFAQLERENTAENVRENMIDRAKMGIWNGGPVNYGFDVEKEVFIINREEKTLSKLVENEIELKNIDKFVEWYMASKGSIRNNCALASKHGIKTKLGKIWNTNQMARTLRNPIYCIADQDAYEYFSNLGVMIVNPPEEFDGTRGLMYYNRRKPYGKNNTKFRPKDEWILAIGAHKGRIPGKTFVAIQKKLDINGEKPPRTGTSSRAKLRNVKCGLCGKALSFSYARGDERDEYGRPIYTYYKCSTYRFTGGQGCRGQSVRASLLEEACEKQLALLGQNKDFLQSAFDKAKSSLIIDIKPVEEETNRIKKQLSELDEEEKNLVIALGKKTLPERLIQSRINEIEKEKAPLIERLEELTIQLRTMEVQDLDIDYVYYCLKNFSETYYDLPYEAQAAILDSLIKEVVYLEGNVTIKLNIEPTPPPSDGGPGKSSESGFNLLRFDTAGTRVWNKNTTNEPELVFAFSTIRPLPESNLGERLRKARIEKDLFIKTLAKETNTDQFTLINWEKNKVFPPPYNLKPVADYLGVSMAYLYGEEFLRFANTGEELKVKRYLFGLKQEQAAKVVGVSVDSWIRWETGRGKPHKQYHSKLREIFGEFKTL